MNKILENLENFPEFEDFKNGATTANTIYIVTQPTDIGTRHITLADHTTLIFAGGMITGSGTLTGNYTRLEAPVTQIFDTHITVDGIWEMDRAYPQWFGAKNDIQYNEITTVKDRLNAAAAIKDENEEEEKKKRDAAIQAIIDDIKANGTDSSDAINKAMKLKHAGEVFIPKGHYMITETLQVPHGIVLRGELTDYNYNKINNTTYPDGDYPLGGDIPSTLTVYYKQGTIIRPLNTAYPLTSNSQTGILQTSFEDNFTIMINAKKQETLKDDGTVEISYPWVVEYPQGLTTIRDIQFLNDWTKTPSIKGIYCAGGMKLENLSWNGFVQAVAMYDNYSDGKTVINCKFYAPIDSNFFIQK